MRTLCPQHTLQNLLKAMGLYDGVSEVCCSEFSPHTRPVLSGFSRVLDAFFLRVSLTKIFSQRVQPVFFKQDCGSETLELPLKGVPGLHLLLLPLPPRPCPSSQGSVCRCFSCVCWCPQRMLNLVCHHDPPLAHETWSVLLRNPAPALVTWPSFSCPPSSVGMSGSMGSPWGQSQCPLRV